ncbi:hypothetical protein MAR_022459 [Mya arenaria]|uniref:DUF4789 domain-containing protein n=1 Tax=Mya arenaria TaxID=6604 RepID=A0ABY7DK52_MYAAR|nr:hypothetical protein MAR_022459 [Mya arenaria]
MDACPEVYCLEPPAETPSESLLCNDTIHEIEELCLAANDIPSAEKRVSGYKPNVGETFPCDYYLRPGWYSTCGYVLSSQTEGCGTVFSWYRKDDLPVKGYGEVTVCLSGTSCAENKTITAARCQDGSYIFELSPMDACPEAYCLEPTVENPTENMLCKDTFRDAKASSHSQRNVVSVVVVIVACVLIVIIVIVLVCRKKVTRNLQTLEPYGTNCVKAKKYAVNTEEYCEDIRNPLPPYTESHLTSKTDKIL